MIVWFDKDMQMHIERNAEAFNNFALAKYDLPEAVFKANAVVDGKTLLFTHAHVTSNAANVIGDYWCCATTRRKKFFDRYLSTIEDAVRNHLRGNRNYKGTIKLRFKIGQTNQEMFSDCGYKFVCENEKVGNDSWWSNACQYVTVEKNLQ